MAKPFLKWAGGKTALLPELLSRVPTSFNRYHEPFLGGGAMFFALSERLQGPSLAGKAKAYLSDLNEELITTYYEVQTRPGLVCDGLSDLATRHSEDLYQRVRDVDPRNTVPTGVAIRMIYLNKSGFNGLYRVNKSGKFNVPWGKRKKFNVDYDGIYAAGRALKSVILSTLAFDKALEFVKGGDFVYFDPPYFPVSDTSNFASYTKEGFGRMSQQILADELVKLNRRGAKFMLSNADTPEARALYNGWHIESVEAPRRISAKNSGREPVRELIVRNYQ